MMKVLWTSPWLSVRQDGDCDEFFAAKDEVLVVAFDADGAMLLVEEPAPAFGANQLFLPGGAAMFEERFGPDAVKQLALRAEAARTGIPATLAAIKRTAEGG